MKGSLLLVTSQFWEVSYCRKFEAFFLRRKEHFKFLSMILGLKIWWNVVCDLACTCGFTELRQGGSAWTWQYCSRCVCGGSVASERHSAVLQWKDDWLDRLQANFACWGWPEAILQAQGSCTMSRQKAFSQSKDSLWFREMWNLFERSFFKKTCNMETYTTICKTDSQWEFAVWGTQTGGSVTN